MTLLRRIRRWLRALPSRPRLRGLARERYYLVAAIRRNQRDLEVILEHSPSRGHCCPWCGAGPLARKIDAKLNRQYGRLAVLDLKLGIPEDADHDRRWRAEQRREHGHIEFFSADQWRKPR